MTTKWTFLGLGAKYAGRCIGCGRDTGSRPFELEATLLYKSSDGKFGVAHDMCAGVRVKSRVGGGRKLVGAPKSF